ncbi:MAG: mycofactocin-associated electron transfer flavoprotein beta subunit [Streptosporangiaceae bacterium]|nr:mycofactocin-associated electron transfer flavoprotein beta subunit [Streptosporangiaceae bacterium]
MGVPRYIAAALKWVDLRPEVDPLAGTVRHDTRTSGLSLADAAALEWALRLGESWQLPVAAITAGPPEARAVLRDAAGFGPTRLVHVAADRDAPSDAIARALAPLLAGAAVVCCGDYSADRGSGSVPAFLAHHLQAAQALGLTSLAPEHPGSLVAQRRLDGGRRERLQVSAPAVISVEPGAAQLRRAPLSGLLAAGRAAVETAAADQAPEYGSRVHLLRTTSYRPRPKVLAPPRDQLPRARLLALTGALSERMPPRVVRAAPEQAADQLIGYLTDNGYLG